MKPTRRVLLLFAALLAGCNFVTGLPERLAGGGPPVPMTDPAPEEAFAPPEEYNAYNNPADAPWDIPLLAEDQIEDYFSAGDMLTYDTGEWYYDVLDFYKAEMPARGWELADEEIGPQHASLTYEKGERSAQVEINAAGNYEGIKTPPCRVDVFWSEE